MRSTPSPHSWPTALALAILFAVVAQSAGAQSVYRWVDEQGRIHYDDLNSSRGQRVTREYMAKRSIPDEPDWTGIISGELVAEVRQRCDNARGRLKSYGDAPEIYGRDPSGNVYKLSPTQAHLMLDEIRQETAYYCGADAPRRVYEDRKAETEARRQREALATRNRSGTTSGSR